MVYQYMAMLYYGQSDTWNTIYAKSCKLLSLERSSGENIRGICILTGHLSNVGTLPGLGKVLKPLLVMIMHSIIVMIYIWKPDFMRNWN